MILRLTSPEAVSPVLTPDWATVVTGVTTGRAGSTDPPAGAEVRPGAVATAGADPPAGLLRPCCGCQVLTGGLTGGHNKVRPLPLQRQTGAGRADHVRAGTVENCLEGLQHLQTFLVNIKLYVKN